LGPNLIGIVPARSIYFSCYSKGKELYTKLNGNVENALVHTASAITSGSCTALCTNPIWLVKTRMQLQSEARMKNSNIALYRNSLHCIQSVIKQEGIFGLYNGLSASLLGLSESTLQFVMYEHFKAKILDTKFKSGQEAPSMSMFSYITFPF
jgi:solute carrier family 25 protein 33/36